MSLPKAVNLKPKLLDRKLSSLSLKPRHDMLNPETWDFGKVAYLINQRDLRTRVPQEAGLSGLLLLIPKILRDRSILQHHNSQGTGYLGSCQDFFSTVTLNP